MSDKGYNSIAKVCFHTMWSGWCEELVERINVETKQDLSQVTVGDNNCDVQL